MKKIFFPIIVVLISTPCAFANPTQSGVSGLLAVPSADTLDSGNLCIGLWGDLSKNKNSGKHAVVLPATLTLGIGSFWEIYGSYPNLLFNNQQELSGKGTANLGTKLRLYGTRSSNVKIAVDISANRHVADDPVVNGVTDVGGRLVASFITQRFAVHGYGGYLSKGKQPGTAGSDQMLYGGGIELSPTSRTKVTLELTGGQNSKSGNSLKDAPIESLVGFQYYISPHLTFNAGAGKQVNSSGQDWRAIIGFTTCQGIGTYIKPVPRLVLEPDEKPRQVVKAAKITPISSMLLKSTAIAPASKLEIPVDSDREEIVIKPYGQVVIPPQPQRAQSSLPVMPVLQPAQPPVQPAQPPVQPAQPPVQPAQPPVQPAQPPVQPAQPVSSIQPVQVPVQVIPAVPLVPVAIKSIPTPPLAAATTQPFSAVQPVTTAVQPVPAVQPTEERVSQGESVTPVDIQIEGQTPLYSVDVRGDKVEVLSGSSQLPSKTATVYRKFRIPDVMAEFGQMDLSDEVKRSLSEVAEYIRADKKTAYIRIEGYTDSIGSERYDMDLSLKRAIAVAHYLVTREGIDPKMLFVKGMGKTKLLAGNETTEGRRINRRFEILFLVPKGT